MGPVEKKTVLGMRGRLFRAELQVRLSKVKELQRPFWKFHAGSSSGSGSGRPSVDSSTSSSSSESAFGKGVLTGEVNSMGAASRRTLIAGESLKSTKADSPANSSMNAI